MYDEQESREHELAPELAALERQLRRAMPAPPRVDRDRMMFAAGQAAAWRESGRGGRAMYDREGRPLYVALSSRAANRVWPAATFTMTAATLLLATMLVWQNRRQPLAEQPVPVQPTIVAKNESHDVVMERPWRLAPRSAWAAIPSTNSGYLGIRYVALTRGIGALSPELESPNGDDLPSRGHVELTTQRGLLHEFLPTSHPSNPSRS
jgi:hypothetical protein